MVSSAVTVCSFPSAAHRTSLGGSFRRRIDVDRVAGVGAAANAADRSGRVLARARTADCGFGPAPVAARSGHGAYTVWLTRPTRTPPIAGETAGRAGRPQRGSKREPSTRPMCRDGTMPEGKGHRDARGSRCAKHGGEDSPEGHGSTGQRGGRSPGPIALWASVARRGGPAARRRSRRRRRPGASRGCSGSPGVRYWRRG